jgi:polar amino acid transport system permease protein
VGEAGNDVAEQPPVAPVAIKAVPVRHPGRWLASAVVLFLLVSLGDSVATNRRFQWSIVDHYLFYGTILRGLVVTLELTAISMAIGIALGLVLAIMRLSPNPLLRTASWVYIWLFRGTPVYVQILFWGFFGALYPRLSVGLPFGGPQLYHANTNSVITIFVAAILGLGLNEAAYMSEIVRAGIQSVNEGQTEAAYALGMTRLATLRRIVLPQAMRLIIPPTGNETISMLKTTSLVSVIAVTELLYAAEQIYAVNYDTIQLLIVASIWYLVVTTVLSIGQYYVERHYRRGSSRELPPTLLQLLRRNVFTAAHATVETPEERR